MAKTILLGREVACLFPEIFDQLRVSGFLPVIARTSEAVQPLLDADPPFDNVLVLVTCPYLEDVFRSDILEVGVLFHDILSPDEWEMLDSARAASSSRDGRIIYSMGVIASHVLRWARNQAPQGCALRA